MKNTIYNLDNSWFIAKDAENEGISGGWEKAVRADAVEAFVPSIIQMFFPEYHGLAYYWCRFTPELDLCEGGRVIIRFGGADYKADVWLNGVYLGSEEGGETPFSFDVTDCVKLGCENLLAVRVLNPCDKTIDGLNLMNTPHRNKFVKKSAGSCLNHGGLWYGVSLASVPSAYISDTFVNAEFNTGKVIAKITVDSTVSADAKIKIRVSEKSPAATTVAEEELKVSLPVGKSESELELTIPDFKPWHVDTPNLYIASVTVITDGGEHTADTRFGFREFSVRDGFFYLNGKKLLLKSSHSGNAFPIGQMMPVDPDHTRRDFIYAKSCGFNMLRAIAGIFRPEQLELADEMGLLIYEECYASWCLGYSMWREWSNDEEYKKLEEYYPDIKLGDEQAMLARWVASTEKMILRDRNHPSVVVWGLLNETKNNSVYRTARDFLPRLRELDPSRFVVLSSGRWDYDFSVGSASNPRSSVWENTWGIDGKPEIFKSFVDGGGNPAKLTPDNHYYPPFPFKQEDKDVFRGYGKDMLPMFLSECGHGPVFNVIDEIRCFRQFGSRRDLEDYTWLEYQANAFSRDFEKYGMNRIFAFPEHVLRMSQRNSAMARRELFDVIRSNPRISGYSLTGLLDHGWCGEGLWSYWRQWKPEVFDTVTDGWAKLRFCLFVNHNEYSDTPVSFEAVLANDHVLASGKYTARFAITSHGCPVYTYSCEFTVDGDELAVPVTKHTVGVSLPAGEYELCAELDEGAPRANTLPFSVKDRKDNSAEGCEVALIGVGDNVRSFLTDSGVKVSDFSGEGTPEVLIADYGDASMVSCALAAALRGSRVLFLDWRTLEPEPALSEIRKVIPDAAIFKRYDWLYHKEIVMLEKSVFEGLGEGLAKGRDFVKEWAKITLKTDTTPDYPIAPAFETGSHMVDGSYYLTHAIAGYNYGTGRVYFNGFEIKHYVGTSPTADRLLINLIKHISK